ncbi:Protein of uncharacterised function (DUF3499) [Corynebacterium kutscheri]|uniref:Protein of uncharacterized function (DUF3499) n=1 Tax=Corynebacterium kutscheri TaxID=35755 RepID=A0A0F6TDA3_9CORY|nr:DUF3499 domain-containing protein [Corynebacterium kutscheri]AKE40699.1 Protein of unknown function (DUF3499) [Corynebacterium kutscheri]VEH04678.1 Protein of uncharacterised function (DUF3499) [Corynebacterium kutscheri]VEH11096.1 Protein of uncharacterised function (DUF3499) [Corynebacterium kutscheri]VEH80426.1 Protein of uncharacterised function (DUF3499) [Corynebacterium kutscheri]
MNQFRRCSRPGCGKPAVATLTYAYARSIAMVGPLIDNDDPHSWDLCEHHAARITAPVNWELVRVEDIEEDDEELTALADSVREPLPATPPPILNSTNDYGAQHPVHRNQRKQVKRGHLSVVPEPSESS